MIDYFGLSIGLAILLLAVDIGSIFESEEAKNLLWFFIVVGLYLMFIIPVLILIGLIALSALSLNNSIFVGEFSIGITIFILGLGTRIKLYIKKSGKNTLWLVLPLILIGFILILLGDVGYL